MYNNTRHSGRMNKKVRESLLAVEKEVALLSDIADGWSTSDQVLVYPLGYIYINFTFSPSSYLCDVFIPVLFFPNFLFDQSCDAPMNMWWVRMGLRGSRSMGSTWSDRCIMWKQDDSGSFKGILLRVTTFELCGTGVAKLDSPAGGRRRRDLVVVLSLIVTAPEKR